MTDTSHATQDSLAVYLRLLRYLRRYWFFLVLSLIGYILFALSQPMFPKLIDWFITALIGHSGQTVSIWGMGDIEANKLALFVPVGIVITGIVRGCGSFFGSYFMAKASLNVIHDLRVNLFDSLIDLPQPFFDQSKSGHLLARITYNTGSVTEAVTEAIKVIIREGLTVMAILAYLVWTNWHLTLVFMLITPIIAGVVAVTSKRFKKLSHTIQNSMGDISHIASEVIYNSRIVKTCGGQSYERKRFSAASRDNAHKGLKMVKVGAIMTPTLQLLILCAMAAMMYTVLHLQDAQTLANTPGELVGFLAAAGLLPKPLRQLSEVVPGVQKGIVAASSIFELLDHPAETDTGGHTAEQVRGHVELRNLCYNYPGSTIQALKNISFSIQPGEVVALIGQSGSGKSTLINLLTRLYCHSEGEILLDGIPIEEYRLSHLRKQIAIVSQQVLLFNDTVASNIAYGDLQGAEKEAVRQAAQAACAMDFIEKLPKGLDTQVGENGVHLSGGQRQRLAIARAILRDAPLLILDEATSALDSHSEQQVQRAIDTMTTDRATLVVAHRLSTIKKADRILVLEQGEIVETGTHDQLIANPRGVYARLHRVHFQENV